MKGFRKTMKKTTAALTAALVVAAAPSTVLAASYVETEKAAVQGLADELAGTWDLQMESSMAQLEQKQAVDMTLNIGEAATQSLNALAGMDFSWLQSIGLNMDASVAGDVESTGIELALNGTTIATLVEYLDFADQVIYAQIPEMFEGAMLVPMTTADMMTSEDGTTTGLTQESIEQLRQALQDPYSFMPDGTTIGDILNRYADIILANMTEGDTYEEALQAGELSTDCTVYEGRINEQNMLDMCKELLTTAKDDEQLKEVIENYTGLMMMGDVYAQFQTWVTDQLASLESETADPEDPTYIFSKIWTDGDGKVVGREIGINDGTDAITLLTYKALEVDGSTALQMSVSDGSEAISLEGSGTVEGDISAGTYKIYNNGLPMAAITVDNYSEKEDGSMTASYTFALEPGMPDEETYSSLGAYTVTLDMASDMAAGTSDITLGVLENGTQLGTLSITGRPDGEPAAFDAASLGTIYDFSDEEAVNTLMASLDWNTILENIGAAGVPDEITQAVLQLLTGGVSADGSTGEAGTGEYEYGESTYTFDVETEAAAG